MVRVRRPGNLLTSLNETNGDVLSNNNQTNKMFLKGRKTDPCRCKLAPNKNQIYADHVPIASSVQGCRQLSLKFQIAAIYQNRYVVVTQSDSPSVLTLLSTALFLSHFLPSPLLLPLTALSPHLACFFALCRSH